MKKLHKDFIKELQDLLARYDADISLNTNMYDQEAIIIDFNRTNERDYSNIRLLWIDKDDLAIEEFQNMIRITNDNLPLVAENEIEYKKKDDEK